MQLPVAAVNTVKGLIDETSPYFLGLYSGSGQQARDPRDGGEQRLSAGDRRAACGQQRPGVSATRFPPDGIDARGDAVDVGQDNFQAVT